MRRRSTWYPWLIAIGLSLASCAGLEPEAGRGPSSAATGPRALLPIRPGVPGRVPFWNGHARRFIHPPAFELEERSGARLYRLTAKSLVDSGSRSFYAPVPWAPLTPIWEDLPVGGVELTVEALSSIAAPPLGVVGRRRFVRSAPFAGATARPAGSFGDAARRGLSAVFHAEAVQYWLRADTPDPAYRLNCYPAKMNGALIRGMVAYAGLTADAAEAQAALQIARRAADFLIGISLDDEAVYRDFPPTYWLGVDAPTRVAVQRVDELMTHYATDAAFGYLDLFDATGEERYLAAAVAIADTYRRTQEADGTWPLLVSAGDGRALAENRLVPTWVVVLLRRLRESHGLEGYEDTCARAFSWILDHPVATFRWDAQFEDITPQAAYRNLSREQACDVARLLLGAADEDPAFVSLARELLDFSEDQFVVWELPPRLDAERGDGIWQPPASTITPCVLEQYSCYLGVARSSAILIETFLTAFEITGEALYRDKARALASGLLTAQERKGTGEFPTWMHDNPEDWMNNSVYAALAVARIAAAPDGADR